MTDLMPRGLSDSSLIAHYGTSADIIASLSPPPLSKATKMAKTRTIYIYGSRLNETMFFSYAPLRPQIMQALDLKLFNVDKTYGKIKRRTLNFYLGSVSDFPLAAHTTRENLPSFSFKEFNLCPSTTEGVFIWTSGDMRAFTVQNEGGFEYVRNHHQHEKLRDYFQLDVLLSVKVEPKRPNLKLV